MFLLDNIVINNCSVYMTPYTMCELIIYLHMCMTKKVQKKKKKYATNIWVTVIVLNLKICNN